MERNCPEPPHGPGLEANGIVDGLIRLRAGFTPPMKAVTFALVMVTVGFAIRWLLPDLGSRFVVLYPVVALTALVGGPISGVVATITIALAASVFLMAPHGSMVIAADSDRISLANFVFTGLVISLISALDRSIGVRVVSALRDKVKAEQRHRAMIEILHEGVILFARDGSVITHNPSAERILGHPAGTLAAYPPGFVDWGLVHEDGTTMDREEFPVIRVLETGAPIHDQLIGVRRGGDVTWLLNNADPMVDPVSGAIEGVVVSFVDVSERRRTLRQLTENRARLASVFDSLQEGVAVFDADGRLSSCNRAAERILRRSAEDLVGGSSLLAVDRRVVREDGSDFPLGERPIRRALATGASTRDVLAGIWDATGLFWIRLNVEPVIDPGSGRLVAVVASFTDVTERRRREVELAESRAHLASIFAAVHEGIVVFSPEGRPISWNPSAERMLRLEGAAPASERPVFEDRTLVREDGSALPTAEYPAVRTLATGDAVHGVILGVPVEAGHMWLMVNSEPIRDPATGAVTAAVVSLNDVSDAIRARRELEESRARFASVVSSAMDAIISVDETQRIVLFNDAAERMLGLPAAEALGGTLDRFVPPTRRDAHAAGFRRFAQEGAGTRHLDKGMILTALRADGGEFPIEASISRTEIDGRPLFTVVMRDITARLAAERVDAQLAAVVRSSPDAILQVSFDGRIETWNDAGTRIFGYTADEAIGQPIGFLSFPELPVTGTEIFRRVLAGETVRNEVIRRRKDGTAVEIASAAAPIRDSAGRVVAGVAILGDISERKRHERHLAERDQELRQTLDAAGLGVWWVQIDTGLVHCDPRSRALFGAGECEAVEAVAGRLHAGDRELFLSLRDRIAGGAPIVLRRSADGEPMWLSITARLRRKLGDGEEIWGTVQDISEARRAEETIRRSEAARRLEALGRMTGGIAHDLNNLLTVISGNLQLLEMTPGSESADRWIAEALKASESGAALNRRLLTFARQRRLDPTLSDLDDLVAGMSDVLRRAVGPTVTITTRLDSAPVRVCIDRSEIENAVLNLVLNARDALPEGGRIVVETRATDIDETNLPPEVGAVVGEYVRLSVSDNGHGMTPEVRARAFDPFFTTKKGDRGSGLGLATLHGFVRQTGGFVTLYSEVGRGTVVNVYLPAVRDEDRAPTPDAERRIPRGAGETILLVEDDADVRVVTRERLEALGYRIETAVDAEDALAIVGAGRRFDLVFTDIVMPGERSGVDLARELRAADPTHLILVASGFAADLLDSADRAEAEFPFLRKPYSLAELATAVEAALRPDAGRSGATPGGAAS